MRNAGGGMRNGRWGITPLAAIRRPYLTCVVALFAAGCEDAPPPVATEAPPAAVVAADEQAPAPAPQPVDLERLRDQTFDDLKFDMEPDDDFDREMLTDKIHALDGQRVRIRGYIKPPAQRRGIKRFVFVRDNQECCFGPGAALYDCILVTMQPGKSAEYTIRPVAVEGKLTIEEYYGPDDRPWAIFRLAGETVE